MTRYRTLLSAALLASGLGLAAIPAVAAPADCGPQGMGGMGGAHWEHRADRMAQHHKMLHDALKLTAEQEGAWKKLMDSEQPMAKGPAGMPEEWAKLTTPERADRMLERMKAHQTQMVEHVAALKEFYAALSPEQQKSFDQFHAGQKGGTRGMRHGRRAAPAAQKP